MSSDIVRLNTWIGIDPGVKGGIVVVTDGVATRSPYWQSLKGMGRYDIRNWFRQNFGTDPNTYYNFHVCIEKVGGFIGEETETGKKNVASAHSTFVLGRNYGNLEMVLVCSNISFKEIPPKEWQAKYGMKRLKGESTPKWKGRLYQKAKELFPDVTFTKELADAFLIAHYCRSLRTW